MQRGEPASRKELQEFVTTLYAQYQEAYGHAGAATQRMKEVWYYMIHLFEDCQRLEKKMRRLSTPRDYEQVETAIFQELSLGSDVQTKL